MQGGVVQGIGWALNEEYIYSDDGNLENPGFLDYRIPVASDLPMIETCIVEVPNPSQSLRRARRRRGGHRAAAAGDGQRCGRCHRRGAFSDLPLSPPRVLEALTAAES